MPGRVDAAASACWPGGTWKRRESWNQSGTWWRKGVLARTQRAGLCCLAALCSPSLRCCAHILFPALFCSPLSHLHGQTLALWLGGSGTTPALLSHNPLPSLHRTFSSFPLLFHEWIGVIWDYHIRSFIRWPFVVIIVIFLEKIIVWETFGVQMHFTDVDSVMGWFWCLCNSRFFSVCFGCFWCWFGVLCSSTAMHHLQ